MVDATDLEQAVGVTSDPLVSYGEYPRHDAYSEAQVERFASGALRQVLYSVLQVSEHASLAFSAAGAANAPVTKRANAISCKCMLIRN